MAAGVSATDPEAPEQLLGEEPELTFRRYAIAFHVAARWCGEDEPALRGETRVERAMESYEDDMLLYAHRDEAPFLTRVVPTEMKAVTVRFPPELPYEAEGRRKRLRCAGATEVGRTRVFGVALGQTWFERSELAILSLVLTPLKPPAEDSSLNEYDVIKLVKLWEGGESVADGACSIAEGRDVRFVAPPGERATLHHLAALAFPGWQQLSYEQAGCEEDVVTTARSGYRVGTVELELPPNEWRQELFRDIATLETRREAPNSEGKRLDRAVAVGGILQGLLDFRQIEDDELADVFADVEVDPEDETMRAFHKGTLLSLSAEADPEDEDEERPSPIGVDPYLAVPNIVLLHDEQRLKTARLRERDLSIRQRGPLRGSPRRAAIDETENGLSEMAGLLAQHLPNVFHYTSERELQKRGRQSRGIDDLEAFMRLRMDDLSSVLQTRVRRRDRWTAVLGIAVGVVTAFLVQQAIEGRPLWLIVLAGAVLFGVFLKVRDWIF